MAASERHAHASTPRAFSTLFFASEKAFFCFLFELSFVFRRIESPKTGADGRVTALTGTAERGGPLAAS
eukprot:CAMPEP_0118894584 /NCGR_PEP_ID=MMETSP1166-20130328/3300_1 /TAXON_ID=1104430 /ORGANISM="Chrysoreinhardia sp, Strain CCMP3193" /LENGTH=68 /DNA_ID=CAMNT_0006833513 /DNA_START=42 /DNA_END=244 /DNA_ORIENTATION=+